MHDGMKGRMISQSLSHSKRKGTLARSFCESCCLVRANRGALGCFGLCVPTPRECSKVQHWDRPPGSHLLLFWAPKHAQILPSTCSCVPHPRGRWKEGLVIFSRRNMGLEKTPTSPLSYPFMGFSNNGNLF